MALASSIVVEGTTTSSTREAICVDFVIVSARKEHQINILIWPIAKSLKVFAVQSNREPSPSIIN